MFCHDSSLLNFNYRFVDRDMIMRYHWGLGIGHIHSHGLIDNVNMEANAHEQDNPLPPLITDGSGGSKNSVDHTSYENNNNTESPTDQDKEAALNPQLDSCTEMEEVVENKNRRDIEKKDARDDSDAGDIGNEDMKGAENNDRGDVGNEYPGDDNMDDEDSESGEMKEINFELELDIDEMFGDVDSDDDVFSYN